MADSKNKNKAKTASIKVVDVTPPGESQPSPTSKAIVISNHPLLQDPMMVKASAPTNDSNDGNPSEEPKQPTDAPIANPSATRLVLKPLTPDLADQIAAAESRKQAIDTLPGEQSVPADLGVSEKQATDSEAQELTPIPVPALPIADLSPPPVKDPEPAVEKPVASPISDVAPPPKEEPKVALSNTAHGIGSNAKSFDEVKTVVPGDSAEAAEEAAKQAALKHDKEVEKLIEEKTYFLSINAQGAKRVRQFIVLGLVISLLLALCWLDVALDAGIIHIAGVRPLTHFFTK